MLAYENAASTSQFINVTVRRPTTDDYIILNNYSSNIRGVIVESAYTWLFLFTYR